MPSVSEKQQNFFKYIGAVKKKKVKKPSEKAMKVASRMTGKQISDFASKTDK